MFAESKAHTKAVDLELRRIDVQQSNQHVQYLAAYMPDTFMSRGGMCMLHLIMYLSSLISKVMSWSGSVNSH
jgi:dynactin 1